MCSKKLSYLILTLGVSLIFAMGAAARERPSVGASISNITFTDVEGHEASLDQYFDRVIVLSFSDRTSSVRLQEWMEPANLTLFKHQPNLRMAYVSIADVTSVPSLFHGIVRRVIKSVSQSAHKKLAQTYRDHNLQLGQAQRVLHVVPDWRGDHLARFGLDDAEKYTLWIIHKGVVVAVFNEDHPDLKARYVSAIRKIVTQSPLSWSKQ